MAETDVSICTLSIWPSTYQRFAHPSFPPNAERDEGGLTGRRGRLDEGRRGMLDFVMHSEEEGRTDRPGPGKLDRRLDRRRRGMFSSRRRR
jgi:hypothetical protein